MRKLSGRDVCFIALVVLLSMGFAWLLLPFFGALLWAVVLAVMFDPLQRHLVRKWHGRANLAAAASVLICICIVIIPATLLLAALAQDANRLYQHIGAEDFDPSALLRRLHAALPEALANLLGSFDSLQERASAAASEATRAVASRLVRVGQGTAQFLISVGVMLYVLFFLFRDGARIVAAMRAASPLSEHNTQHLLQKFTDVLKATVKGNFILALLQGAIGGVTFWALGIEGALLWGMVMVALSLLPAIGAALVWGPVAAYLLLTGEYLRGTILLGVGLVIISMIDNFLRPVLVGKDIHLPDYLVLVSTLGGLALFGMNGFVIGPLIAALFLAAWSLLGEERANNWQR